MAPLVLRVTCKRMSLDGEPNRPRGRRGHLSLARQNGGCIVITAATLVRPEFRISVQASEYLAPGSVWPTSAVGLLRRFSVSVFRPLRPAAVLTWLATSPTVQHIEIQGEWKR